MKVEIKKLQMHDLVKVGIPAVTSRNVGMCPVAAFTLPEMQVELLNRLSVRIQRAPKGHIECN